jgi:hypothetical protein
MRPLARNLDRPNRMVEYVIGYVTGYYVGIIFLNSPFSAYFLGFVTVYLAYRLTKDKPEGIMIRLAYKFSPFKMKFFLPSPKLAPRLEI